MEAVFYVQVCAPSIILEAAILVMCLLSFTITTHTRLEINTLGPCTHANHWYTLNCTVIKHHSLCQRHRSERQTCHACLSWERSTFIQEKRKKRGKNLLCRHTCKNTLWGWWGRKIRLYIHWPALLVKEPGTLDSNFMLSPLNHSPCRAFK